MMENNHQSKPNHDIELLSKRVCGLRKAVSWQPASCLCDLCLKQMMELGRAVDVLNELLWLKLLKEGTKREEPHRGAINERGKARPGSD